MSESFFIWAFNIVLEILKSFGNPVDYPNKSGFTNVAIFWNFQLVLNLMNERHPIQFPTILGPALEKISLSSSNRILYSAIYKKHFAPHRPSEEMAKKLIFGHQNVFFTTLFQQTAEKKPSMLRI